MRQIKIKVIPRAKKNSIVQTDGVCRVHLTAPATDGKANKALVEIIAEHFGKRKNQIEIIKGLKSREKTISIKD